MKFEGKACPICGKGKMEAIRHEADPGIYVDAYKCNKCGEIAYAERIIKILEAIGNRGKEERHMVKVGSSLAVTIPAAFVKKLGLRPKDPVHISMDENSLLITRGQRMGALRQI
ncbi:MAG: AbrB/MazE/SpoVT family DNA-binding domain-containing protein [Candidatus Micrarchaeota archaeon]